MDGFRNQTGSVKNKTRRKIIENLINLAPKQNDIRKLVFKGLSNNPKQLPAWFLYDKEGSRLFEKICEQPEYSLTRTEIILLNKKAKDISQAIGTGIIVEFGAGNARKVGSLLKHLEQPVYVALDISADYLKESIKSLQVKFPDIPMLGICCDHSSLEKLPDHPLLKNKRRIGFFPGSSLGNFEPNEAIKLLKRFRHLLNGGPLLIGIDHPKTASRQEAAYNDSAGVSAAFAQNLLHRLNKELEANFNVKNFSYQALWQSKESRVEMKLISKCDQIVTIAGQNWAFKIGESLITEYSFKYTPKDALQLVTKAGWQGLNRWHDLDDDFSLHLLEPSK